MADVLRVNHGILDEVRRDDQGVTLFQRIMKRVTDVEAEWQRSSTVNAETNELKYKIQAQLVRHVFCDSY